ncbi:hypothetical protein H0H87_008738, partial [Tephrocybe sp. NHM501043]
MGIVASIFAESYPPKPTFSVDHIPDLEGKVIIVTGSNAMHGHNLCIIIALLAKNAKVYMAARSPQKAKAAIEELRAQTGKDAVFLKLDLADLKSVKAAAAEFQEKEKELHILFNNGGVMNPPLGEVTADGYDLQWGTNVLGHFYFTKLLLPTLISTAKASPEKHVRVLTTSSVTHYYGSLDFNTFKDGPARRNKLFALYHLYSQSKLVHLRGSLGDLILAMELARRYGDQGIVSTAINPGNLETELTRHMSSIQRAVM